MGTASSSNRRPLSPDDISPIPYKKDSSYYENLLLAGGKHIFNKHGTYGGHLSHKGAESEIASNHKEVKTLYTVFRWERGGRSVFLSGDWDNWKSKIPLVASQGNFATILQIPEGVHQYKFFVDNKWVTDDNQPMVDNDLGTKNNVIEVKKTDFEVFDALAVDIASLRHAKDILNLPQSDDIFKNKSAEEQQAYLKHVAPGGLLISTPSPKNYLGQNKSKNRSHDASQPIDPIANPSTKLPLALNSIDDSMDYFTLWDYGQNIPPRQPPNIDQLGFENSNKAFLSEPPMLPPQLLQVLLNRDIPYYYEPALLPEPASRAVLNHLYALSIKDGVMAVSCTHRHKKKYVTTLYYKQVK